MASDKILNVDSNSFDKIVSQSKVPVLVDFWAPWCGPCKAIAPILDELADELAGSTQICKVNVDDNSDLATRFGIRAIPTMIIFKEGKNVDQIVGLSNKADIKNKLKSHA